MLLSSSNSFTKPIKQIFINEYQKLHTKGEKRVRGVTLSSEGKIPIFTIKVTLFIKIRLLYWAGALTAC